jgi:hypothetical protein
MDEQLVLNLAEVNVAGGRYNDPVGEKTPGRI